MVTALRGAPPPLVESVIEKRVYQEEVPKDFDWFFYKNNYPDLQHITSHQDAEKHYIQHGRQEGRIYKSASPVISDLQVMERIQTDHDWVIYKPSHSQSKSHVTEESEVILPTDFDWLAYKSNNSDLSISTQAEAIRHYKEHGYKENRTYVRQVSEAVNQISENGTPAGFNWIYYRSKYEDLRYKISNEQEAIKHYLEHGRREGRNYVANPEEEPKQSVPPPKHKLSTRRQLRQQHLVQAQIPQVPPPVPLPVPPPVPSRVSARVHASTARSKLPSSKKLSEQPLKKLDVSKKFYRWGELKIISTPPPTEGQIPNIIHFIYGFKEPPHPDQDPYVPFDLVKYIAIFSAYCLNKPEKIYFHYKYEPVGPWWDKIKPFLTLHQMDPPDTVFGRKITQYTQKADLVRLQLMMTQGGIYLDIDTICLRSIKPFMNYECVMGIQGENYGLCNAVILSKPNTEFVQRWYDSYQSFQKWDLQSVQIPYNLSKVYPITILPYDAFFYPLWNRFGEWMLSEPINVDCCHRLFQNSYCIHLWEMWCGRELQRITEDSLFKQHTAYNLIARKFISNQVTLIMVVSDAIACPDNIVETIGFYYKIVARDEVKEMIIYNNKGADSIVPSTTTASNITTVAYLNNLPKINPKFRVLHANQVEALPYIRKMLCDTVKTGIIVWLEQLLIITESQLDLCIELLYDESVGVLGLAGGNFIKTHKYESVIATQQPVVVDGVMGCHIYRSELQHYGIKIKTDQKLYDFDFCCQVKNLEKHVLLLVGEPRFPQSPSFLLPQATKENWNQLFDEYR